LTLALSEDLNPERKTLKEYYLGCILTLAKEVLGPLLRILNFLDQPDVVLQEGSDRD
jgi:hypothetical protein